MKRNIGIDVGFINLSWENIGVRDVGIIFDDEDFCFCIERMDLLSEIMELIKKSEGFSWMDFNRWVY